MDYRTLDTPNTIDLMRYLLEGYDANSTNKYTIPGFYVALNLVED